MRFTEGSEAIDYKQYFNSLVAGLSDKEKSIVLNNSYTEKQAISIVSKLTNMGYVQCLGGIFSIGASIGLRCDIEGNRINETPPRLIQVPSFYISKTVVSNKEFEAFDTRRTRTNTSAGDNHPVTCVRYGRVISYVKWLNDNSGLNFCLPTEPQMYVATSPAGWEYPYQEKGKPSRVMSNMYKSFIDAYPEGEAASTLEVDDPRVPTNYLGLHHMGGNVSVFTFGHFKAPGHWGSESDGAYNVTVGGNFRTCPYGARTVGRGIIDIAGAVDTLGFRLIHPDPLLHISD